MTAAGFSSAKTERKKEIISCASSLPADPGGYMPRKTRSMIGPSGVSAIRSYSESNLAMVWFVKNYTGLQPFTINTYPTVFAEDKELRIAATHQHSVLRDRVIGHYADRVFGNHRIPDLIGCGI